MSTQMYAQRHCRVYYLHGFEFLNNKRQLPRTLNHKNQVNVQ